MGKDWIVSSESNFGSLKRGTLRGAGTSPLSSVPVTTLVSTKVLIKRIAEIGDKSKRF